MLFYQFKKQRKTHILDNLDAAPPVTFATRS